MSRLVRDIDVSRLNALLDSRVLAAVLAGVVAIAFTPARPWLDDAYIVMHSADVLRAGVDPVYQVPALTGITSPAYLLLVYLLERIGCSGLLAVRIATIAGVWTFLIGVWTLAASAGASGLKRIPVLAAAALAGWMATNITNGLETGWATALVVWAIVFTRENRTIAASAVAGVLPWLRPDLTLVAGTYVLVALVRVNGRRWLPVAVALAVALPFLLWMRIDTGWWWPQTIAAKRQFFAEGCLPLESRIGAARGYLTAWADAALPLAIGLAVMPFDWLGRIALPAVIASLATYTWQLPGALFHNDHRYIIPILAPWAVLGVAGLVHRLPRAGTVAIALALVLGNAPIAPPFAERRAIGDDLIETGRWVADHVPADATLLVHDAGAIAVYGRHRAVDLVGLKTPSSIEAHAQTWASCGRRRGDAIDAVARLARPDYLVVLNGWDGIFRITRALAAHGWRLTPVWVQSTRPSSFAFYALAGPAPAADRRVTSPSQTNSASVEIAAP
jgi:hypothetical protein